MIEQQIRTWEVLDQQVLDLIGQMRREQFVPSQPVLVEEFVDLMHVAGLPEVHQAMNAVDQWNGLSVGRFISQRLVLPL